MVNDLISLADLTGDEILGLLEFAGELKQMQKARIPHRLLEGKTLAMIFEKPSLRTRLTFQTGMFQLGGSSVLMDMRLGERESVPDVARNLDRWVDGIMARTFRHDHIVELAQYASVPVINALTDLLHPCQILADAQTLREHRGKDLGSLKLAFVGDGNNVFHSWANFASRVPLNLTLVCPEGYEPNMELVSRARQSAKGEIAITHDIGVGVRNADVVYTDVWASMGQEEEVNKRKIIFKDFQINSKLLSGADPKVLVMHCLPAHRGEEITDEVLDSKNSIVFDQAENRMHVQKAILIKLLGKN